MPDVIKVLVKEDGTLETDLSGMSYSPEQKRQLQKDLAKALGGTVAKEGHKPKMAAQTERRREQT
jgi:hypothetical protein